jgi:CheY-like chemotaxis protein
MRVRGMEVTTATSATEALKKVQEESYNVIILDLQMPQIDDQNNMLDTFRDKLMRFWNN